MKFFKKYCLLEESQRERPHINAVGVQSLYFVQTKFPPPCPEVNKQSLFTGENLDK